MSQCNAALLSDRAVVRVVGPGAHAFLQGLITNDIDKANPGSAIHAGLLTPQGKILFDFFVVPAADGSCWTRPSRKVRRACAAPRLLSTPRAGPNRRRSLVHRRGSLGHGTSTSGGRRRLCRSPPAGTWATYSASRRYKCWRPRLCPRHRGRVSCETHRACRAGGRTRLCIWRHLSARSHVRSA